MKKRIRINLIVSTQTFANNVKSAIDTFLANKSKFAEDSPIEVMQDDSGQWHVIGDIRFNVDSDAEGWVSDLKDRWTSGALSSRILAGSKIKIHTCSHDGEVIKCSETAAQLREEVK